MLAVHGRGWAIGRKSLPGGYSRPRISCHRVQTYVRSLCGWFGLEEFKDPVAGFHSLIEIKSQFLKQFA